MRFQIRSTLGLLSAAAVVARAQLVYADNHAAVSKDSDAVSANFKDVEGVELHSPAFANNTDLPEGWTNGTSGPTNQFAMEYFLQTLAARNSWMTYYNPTWRSEEGRSLPYVFLSSSGSGQPAPLQSYGNTTASESLKVRVWLQVCALL